MRERTEIELMSCNLTDRLAPAAGRDKEFHMGEKMVQEPLVSVCIPTYNRARKLKRAVEKLMVCSYKNLEIIISDDASSDDTQNVCSALAGSDGRIKYFRQAENIGPTMNYEFTNAKVTGKYFLWLSDDDYLDYDYIMTCVDQLERKPLLVLVAGLGAYYRDGKELSYYGNIVQPSSEYSLLRAITYLWSAGDSSILYGVYRVNSVMDCKMPNCLAGDWIWVADVLLKGCAEVIPTTYVNREFGDSMSSSFKRYASIINAPVWHGNFPLLAISMNVASYIAFESKEYKGKSKSIKAAVYLLIYCLLLTKFSIIKIRLFASKVPFAKRIYRRFIKVL